MPDVTNIDSELMKLFGKHEAPMPLFAFHAMIERN